MTSRYDPFFNVNDLPDEPEEEEYAAWIDIMGAGDGMIHHTDATAVNIGKLYTAVAESLPEDDYSVFPMADGVYITSQSLDPLLRNTVLIFYKFSQSMIALQEDDRGIYLGFLIRAGVAEGDIYSGSEVEPTNDDLADRDWFDSVPYGEGVARAYKAESHSPFSISLDEDTDLVTDRVGTLDDERRLRWWEIFHRDFRADLHGFLEEYFDYYSGQSYNNDYSEELIETHRRKADEYLLD